jgi:hypothetical protein
MFAGGAGETNAYRTVPGGRTRRVHALYNPGIETSGQTMRRFLAAVSMTAALLASGPSLAQQPFGRPGPGFPQKGGDPQTVPPRQDARERDRAGPPGRPAERMSPEQRRELRRDIEQHGREIYPDRRRDGRR